jgi:hypothetical protein
MTKDQMPNTKEFPKGEIVGAEPGWFFIVRAKRLKEMRADGYRRDAFVLVLIFVFTTEARKALRRDFDRINGIYRIASRARRASENPKRRRAGALQIAAHTDVT